MTTTHWSEDPTDDLSWNRYASGWDDATADFSQGAGQRTLGAHGAKAYHDGYADGWLVASSAVTA